MQNVFDFFRNLGAVRLSAIAAVALTLVGFFAFVILRMSEPNMRPLYTDLTFDDSIAIVRQLESMGVRHRILQDGAVIMVPNEEILSLRMRMAESGLPTGGSVGYEIFDKADTLGTTSFVQNINHVRALEGELARSIRTIDRVRAARVHLVLPERQLFARERRSPSASIALRVSGQLSDSQIRAIQHLTASAVDGLEPQHVSIIDEAGRLLASGTDETSSGALPSALEERRMAMQGALQRQIESIVENVVGPGRVRVTVAAELDYNRVTQTANIFDPEGRVVRSTQTREEENTSSEQRPNDGVSAANELPGAGGQPGTGDQAQQSSSAIEELVNYEISQTTRTEILEAGRLRRLSVAVLVDGVYITGQGGEMAYQPRDAQQMELITALVRSAMGYDQNRGDALEVVNLQFADAGRQPLVEEPESFLNLTKEDYFYMAELAIMSLLALLVVLFGLRPLLKTMMRKDEPMQPSLAYQGQGQQSVAMIPGPDGTPIPAPATMLPPPNEAVTKANEMIQLAQVQGELQASTIKHVGEMVQANSEEAVNLIRSWINEAA